MMRDIWDCIKFYLLMIWWLVSPLLLALLIFAGIFVVLRLTVPFLVQFLEWLYEVTNPLFRAFGC